MRKGRAKEREGRKKEREEEEEWEETDLHDVGGDLISTLISVPTLHCPLSAESGLVYWPMMDDGVFESVVMTSSFCCSILRKGGHFILRPFLHTSGWTHQSLLAECFVLESPYSRNVLQWNILTYGIFCPTEHPH